MPCQARRREQASPALLRMSGQGPHRRVVDAKDDALASFLGNADLALLSLKLEGGEEDVLPISASMARSSSSPLRISCQRLPSKTMGWR